MEKVEKEEEAEKVVVDEKIRRERSESRAMGEKMRRKRRESRATGEKMARERRRMRREAYPGKLENRFYMGESWIQWNFGSELQMVMLPTRYRQR